MQQKKRPPRHTAQVTIWEDDLAVLDIHAQLNSLKIKWIQKLFGKIFKNVPSKICGRQPLKNLEGYDLPKADLQFFKSLFCKFFLVHS